MLHVSRFASRLVLRSLLTLVPSLRAREVFSVYCLRRSSSYALLPRVVVGDVVKELPPWEVRPSRPRRACPRLVCQASQVPVDVRHVRISDGMAVGTGCRAKFESVPVQTQYALPSNFEHDTSPSRKRVIKVRERSLSTREEEDEWLSQYVQRRVEE